MAPRKKSTKAPAKPANLPPRRESPEPTPERTTRRAEQGRAEYRLLKTADELRNVMGENESDGSGSNTENESSRNNTNQSRPNFSFLPSHKHSSPNAARRANPTSATSHRVTNNPTIQDADSDSQDSPVASTIAGQNTNRNFSRGTTSGEPSTSGRALQPNESTNSSSRKEPRVRKQQVPGQLSVLKEIIKLQGSVHNLIPKMSFARLIREILADQRSAAVRVTSDMLLCLQEASEIYLVQLFEDSYRCTIHRDRCTLMPKDMRLACLLRH